MTLTRFPPTHSKTNNLRDKDDPTARVERCEWCGDDGWVTLAGTITVGGCTYERGMAPCRGCRLGAKIYTYQFTKYRTFEDYTEEDVDRNSVPADPKQRVVYHRPPKLRLTTPAQLAAETLAAFAGEEPPPPPPPEAQDDGIPF